MTIKTRAALAAAAAIALTVSAAAQTVVPEGTFIAEEAATQYLAKDRLIGTKVKGPDGKIIGDIEDVILTGDSQVIGVVMGTGGYFGLFEKKVGVDINALQFDVNDAGAIVATLPEATQDVIDAAPAFKRNQPKKSLFQRAVEKSQEIRDKTGHSAKEAYESAKEKAGPALEKAKETAKGAIEKAGPALEAAKEKAREAIDSAKEKAAEAVESAKEAAKPAETPSSAPATTPSDAPSAPATTPSDTPAETPPATTTP